MIKNFVNAFEEGLVIKEGARGIYGQFVGRPLDVIQKIKNAKVIDGGLLLVLTRDESILIMGKLEIEYNLNSIKIKNVEKILLNWVEVLKKYDELPFEFFY